jgi:hypothetical protein
MTFIYLNGYDVWIWKKSMLLFLFIYWWWLRSPSAGHRNGPQIKIVETYTGTYMTINWKELEIRLIVLFVFGFNHSTIFWFVLSNPQSLKVMGVVLCQFGVGDWISQGPIMTEPWPLSFLSVESTVAYCSCSCQTAVLNRAEPQVRSGRGWPVLRRLQAIANSLARWRNCGNGFPALFNKQGLSDTRHLCWCLVSGKHPGRDYNIMLVRRLCSWEETMNLAVSLLMNRLGSCCS